MRSVLSSATTQGEIQHGGGIEGFNTALAYYPDDKLTVIALANLNGSAPDEIAANVAALAHGEPVRLSSERKEIHVAPEVLSHYVGTYQFPNGPKMLITVNGKQLFTKLGTQEAIPVYPESETMFFQRLWVQRSSLLRTRRAKLPT